MAEKRLGIIGYGNMGAAIGSAILAASALLPSDMAVYEVNSQARKRAEFQEIRVARSMEELCELCDMMLLAVKPDKAAKVLGSAGEALKGKALMSIAAGVTSSKLKEFGGTDSLRVLRIMPNTPAMAGAGCMVLCSDTDFTEEEKAEAERLMSAVGIVEWVEEVQLDAVTGLSGSGPAFVAMFVEALADAGVSQGLSRTQALHLAAQTVMGTAKLIQEQGLHPGELKDMVCSPGGTAIEGVKALEESGFRHAAIRAVVVASEKSKRLI